MNTQEKHTFLQTKIGRVSLFVFLLIGLFSFVSIFTGGSNSSSSQTESTVYVPDKYDVYAQAKTFVGRGLKAPATAKFSALDFEVSELGDREYKIVSYVDSQNSFGALIRSNWSVVMKISGDKWILERMVIGGEVVYDPVQAKKDKQELDSTFAKIQAQLDEAKALTQPR